MKDQYVGDVNDYLKYALLRRLAERDFSVAVVWMLTTPDARRDGRRLSYLAQPEKYRQLDPPLFDSLRELVRRERRDVRAVAREEIIPNTTYVSDVLSDSLLARHSYFHHTWEIAGERDLIFFDPDNGFSVGSVPKGRRNSSKYLYWDELGEAFSRNYSVVVYQHFPRRRRSDYISEIADRVREVTGSRHILGVSTSHVAFFIVPQPAVVKVLSKRLSVFAEGSVLPRRQVVSIEF
jgi:hypothetical protein